MIYDKTCGNVRVAVVEDEGRPQAMIESSVHSIPWLSLEDLRDLRHLIDAALRAAKV